MERNGTYYENNPEGHVLRKGLTSFAKTTLHTRRRADMGQGADKKQHLLILEHNRRPQKTG